MTVTVILLICLLLPHAVAEILIVLAINKVPIVLLLDQSIRDIFDLE